MPQRRIYGAYGGARGVDIACRGKPTNTDSPIRSLVPVTSVTIVFSETHCSTTGHGPQQATVDLDHLLDRLTSNPISCRSSRIRSHDYAPLESECECCSAVCKLDGTIWVGMIVCERTEEA